MEWRFRRCDIPIWFHTISVKAPMNWGVALILRRSDSWSAILPTENQREALSRWVVLAEP